MGSVLVETHVSVLQPLICNSICLAVGFCREVSALLHAVCLMAVADDDVFYLTDERAAAL
jgi:hypothetical protein